MGGAPMASKEHACSLLKRREIKSRTMATESMAESISYYDRAVIGAIFPYIYIYNI